MSETVELPVGLAADIDHYTAERSAALTKARIALGSLDGSAARLANSLSNAELYGHDGAEAAAQVASEVRNLSEQLREITARIR